MSDRSVVPEGAHLVKDHRILWREDRGEGTPRREERRETAIRARIETDDGRAIDCMIRDVSANGAKLGLAPGFDLPQTFRIRAAGGVKVFEARLAWRRGCYAGVSIVGLKR